MIREKISKRKVDNKILSEKICSKCGRPLKKNSENKGHTMCYVCFKISKGKTSVSEHKIIHGEKVFIRKINLIKIQAENIRMYRN